MYRRLALAVVAATILLGACAGDTPDVPAGPDGQPDPQLVLGRAVYQSQCVNCHGSDGGGGTGPKLSDGAVVEAYPDPADEVEVIRAGPRAMPAFGGRLSAEEIDAVVRYTREVL